MSELCRICDKGEEEHKQLEAQRIINHQFSLDGSVTPTDRSPKKKERPAREVMVVPGADLLVRQLLIKKGVLSESDFSDAGALGHRPAEDVSDRAGETPE